MAFVKVVKNKQYFKRFQVKFARRRVGKTDYRARVRMVLQDKNKYNTPRYRLVVRLSNRDVTCQIVYAKLRGDVVLTAAYAHELKRYGMPVQSNNYAASYATGLLCARRLLRKFHLDKIYEGQTTVDGQDYTVSPKEDKRAPFRAVLDVGLARTTTGARVFAALKGALDGGLNVPHKDTRFAGFDRKEKKLKPELLRKKIFAGHVADYMSKLQKDNPGRYKKSFKRFVDAGVKPTDLESLWKKVHAGIRADPSPSKSQAKPPEGGWKIYTKGRRQPMTHTQRKDRIRQRIQAHQLKAKKRADKYAAANPKK